MLCKRMGENVFSHAMSAAKLRIKQISSLLEYFSQRVQKIFEVYLTATTQMRRLRRLNL